MNTNLCNIKSISNKVILIMRMLSIAIQFLQLLRNKNYIETYCFIFIDNLSYPEKYFR